MSKMVEKIRESLDDKNAENVLTELGTRFHRVIYEHLQQYQFNTAGELERDEMRGAGRLWGFTEAGRLGKYSWGIRGNCEREDQKK